MSQVANHMNAMRSAVVGLNARILKLEAAGRPAGDAAAAAGEAEAAEAVKALDALRAQVEAMRKAGEDAARQRKLQEAAATARVDKQLAAGIHAAVTPLRESLAKVAALAETVRRMDEARQRDEQ